MISLVFYVILCTYDSNGMANCNAYETMVWEMPKEDKQEINLALSECELVEKAFINLPGYQDSDCYLK